MTAETVMKIGTEAGSTVRLRTDPAARKRILCATDLSPQSQRAVARATLLSNQLNAQLTLLHVIDAANGMDCSVSVREQVAQQLSSTRLPVRCDLRIQVRKGNCVETIGIVAKEMDADIVVLGAQRRRPLEPLVGMTAERVMRLAGRPALIVNITPRVRYGAVVIAAELTDAFTRVVRIASSLKFLEADSVYVVHGIGSPGIGGSKRGGPAGPHEAAGVASRRQVPGSRLYADAVVAGPPRRSPGRRRRPRHRQPGRALSSRSPPPSPRATRDHWQRR